MDGGELVVSKAGNDRDGKFAFFNDVFTARNQLAMSEGTSVASGGRYTILPLPLSR